MNAPVGLERCLTFINCQLQPSTRALLTRNGTHRRVVTISRQAGSGGHAVAEELASLLQRQAPKEACPWAVFDKNLVEKVLAEHHLPGRLAQFMAEDRISEISDTMDELFGLHPPSWTLVRKTAETILHLAELGNVIIIGRGANVITARLDYVFHVRLVGSWERRVRHMQERNRVSPKEALALVRQQDLGRKRFLKKYFNRDIDDLLLYHLLINTDLVSYPEAAQMIADAVRPKGAEAVAEVAA
jgi:cytidylate kinase